MKGGINKIFLFDSSMELNASFKNSFYQSIRINRRDQILYDIPDSAPLLISESIFYFLKPLFLFKINVLCIPIILN